MSRKLFSFIRHHHMVLSLLVIVMWAPAGLGAC
jgi:hypothetical protein